MAKNKGHLLGKDKSRNTFFPKEGHQEESVVRGPFDGWKHAEERKTGNLFHIAIRHRKKKRHHMEDENTVGCKHGYHGKKESWDDRRQCSSLRKLR